MLNAEELFGIARSKSVEGRTRLAEVVTDLFLDEGDLTDAERALMFDILHKLVREVETSMRVSLSEKIADLKDAPRQLALELANDQIEVAHPILTKSKVLHNEDLIEVIFNRTLEHRMAIAIRDDIDEDVSHALVASGEEEVVKKLLENENAKIGKATLEYVVDESKRVNSYQEPLLNRSDLPKDLAKRMYMWVSAALRQHILGRYDVDKTELDELMENLAQEKISELMEERHNQKKVTALVKDLKEDGSLTADLMLEALQQGVVSLFFAIFEEMTQLTDRLAQRIVYEPRGEGMAIACKAIEVDDDIFEEIFVLSRSSRPQTKKMLRKELRKITDLYEAMTPKAAKKVLSMWQRGTDYLTAVHELEI